MPKFMKNVDTGAVFNYDKVQCLSKHYMNPLSDNEEIEYLESLGLAKVSSNDKTDPMIAVGKSDVDEKAALVSEAEANDIAIDRRWSVDRLRREIDIALAKKENADK